MRKIPSVFVLVVLLFVNIELAQLKAEPVAPAKADAPILANGIHPPIPLNTPEIENPYEGYGQSASCVVSVLVDTRGNVRDPHVVRCSDPDFASYSLDKAAMTKFKPATNREGRPVAYPTILDIIWIAGLHPSVRT